MHRSLRERLIGVILLTLLALTPTALARAGACGAGRYARAETRRPLYEQALRARACRQPRAAVWAKPHVRVILSLTAVYAIVRS